MMQDWKAVDITTLAVFDDLVRDHSSVIVIEDVRGRSKEIGDIIMKSVS
jgi:hypothetical protein|tara:strand:- start:214 stop:360 length:147 start_codon:yes stop_codon:yes gene_type:complete